MRNLVVDLLAEQYPAVAKDLLNPLAELMQVARKACGDDADKFLILLVIGVRTAQDQRFSELTNDELENNPVGVLPSLGTNTRSISDSTGIPKETVRRKLTELTQAGWIVREGNDLLLTCKAYQELVTVRDSIRSLAIRNWETVSGLITTREEPPSIPG
ncbi:hypothetical protein [Phenylobacterium deserti]|uniref:HTH crp-type domain-containing protein n=1 Tax=Phenylobacterium deserti TaxID=1914756 RepID=A0A328A935_9CAUL|nr:hypothetical protein [Phenylobacterium deserti]RAK50837.1 hypothetical protein DJ018_16830 [Phenylobacterium deserti]